MESTEHQEPLTLTITNITAASTFYLSALRPLGYRYISQVQHNLSNGAGSNAIGLGPEHTSRVDLFLSQSSNNHGSQSNSGGSAHVVFPAQTQLQVRSFYSAALAAGGNPVMPPSAPSGGDGMFAAIVADADGNKVEVCYSDSVPQAAAAAHSNGDNISTHSGSQPGGSIQQWRESVADSHGRTMKAPPSSARFVHTQVPPPAATSAAPSRHSSTRRSSHSTTKPPSASGSTKSKAANNQTSTFDVPGGNKTVVGTILGAAAGAALAYTMSRSKQDSVRREDDFHSRMDARDRVKSEAREQSAMLDDHGDGSPWRSKARSSTHRNSYIADRDSGYYSNASHRDNSPVENALVRRSFTYPEPNPYGDKSSQRRSVSTHPNDRPGSTTTRRLIEYPDASQPSPRNQVARPPNYRRGSYSDSGRSHSTVKPAKAHPPAPASSYSTRSARYTAHSIAPPSPPPPVPLLPAGSTRHRRDSHSSSNPSHASHDQGARSYYPDNQPPPRSTASHRSGPPPSSYTIKNSDSYHTARTSNTRARATSSPQQYKQSTTVYPAAPPPAPASALTAKALSSHSSQGKEPRTGSRFDDLESLCPDDSISNVPETEVRPPARSRSVRDSYAGRMANQGSYAARMMGERGHGPPGRRSGVAAG